MCSSLLEIKSFVSFKNEYLLFWMGVDFKGRSQVLQNVEGVAHKGGEGSDTFRVFWGGLGKKR